MSNIPSNLKYTEDHEWLSIEGDIVTVGITYHAQDQLGDIVYVELPEVGDYFVKEDEFGSIESVKSVSEVFAPVSGKIVEINADLDETPELVNSDTYTKGWLIKIKMNDPSQLEALLDAAAYAAVVE